MAVDLLKGPGEIVGVVDGVGVGEEEVASAGGLRAGPAGVVFAGEASARGQVEGWGFEEGDTAVLCGDFGCDIEGLVG